MYNLLCNPHRKEIPMYKIFIRLNDGTEAMFCFSSQEHLDRKLSEIKTFMRMNKPIEIALLGGDSFIFIPANISFLKVYRG